MWSHKPAKSVILFVNLCCAPNRIRSGSSEHFDETLYCTKVSKRCGRLFQMEIMLNTLTFSKLSLKFSFKRCESGKSARRKQFEKTFEYIRKIFQKFELKSHIGKLGIFTHFDLLILCIGSNAHTCSEIRLFIHFYPWRPTNEHVRMWLCDSHVMVKCIAAHIQWMNVEYENQP